ncbi:MULTISPECIES: hypothetical protein [unclassified Micromonospora]|uniref:hypothetical protein n=1 Tax=unclassified Micromonospora TaxID=2617518 RepID=UPI0020B2AEDB|nr:MULTISPECIES: hypothetical protein [unclassified Micromonospora]MDM4779812.1 hypothetical protein [Micromonospora sp. b486]
MFLLGGLVAAGLGALALVMVRRRNAPSGLADQAAPPATRLPAGGDMADAPTAILHLGPPGGGPGRPENGFHDPALTYRHRAATPEGS